jgi:hypothetical protein
MRKNFFTGEDLQFSIEGSLAYARAIQPINKNTFNTNHGDDSNILYLIYIDIGTVIALKPLVS